ncbi:putative RNA-directed DNA polymerase, eukaryota, reverse transcriptase zinc-binding domain protein, partial [Tanacetum coccineum]
MTNTPENTSPKIPFIALSLPKRNNSTTKPKCSIPSKTTSVSISDPIEHSDSLSKINRCNFRILKNHNSPSNSKQLSESILNEVEETINVGINLGFDMIGKDNDIAIIVGLGLTDLPLGGKRFTRMNNLGSQLSKLDRILSVKATDLRNTLNAIDDKESVPLSQAEINTRILVVKELTELEYRKITDLQQKAKIKEPNNSRPTFTSNLFKHLSYEGSLFLDHPFTNQEIKDAVWDCGGDKSPGPEDFTFKFIKKYWNILEKNIISYVKEFEVFHVILANRLPLVISSLVRNTQMAFLKGRQIIDGPLMVNEIIAWAKKHKKRLFLFKVDFEKAFDTLSWAFLNSIMSQMGFSSKWLNWISSCLSSAYASVLINGLPSKEFKVERGLRQGDPLSPFLFILAIEALNIVFLEAKDKNMYKGIDVGKDKVYMSHLQFTDDALFFGEWSLHNAKVLSRILSCFQLASGLKVNLNKSKLFGVGASNLDLNFIANTIGCQPSNLPCIYLGLPIRANMS